MAKYLTNEQNAVDKDGAIAKAVEKAVHSPSHDDLVKGYLAEYDELCKKYGFRLIAVPTLRETNHGTAEIAAVLKVADYQQ